MNFEVCALQLKDIWWLSWVVEREEFCARVSNSPDKIVTSLLRRYK